MTEILVPALAVGGVGLLFGLLLAVASIIFRVDTDERIPEITECLPGANCGGCGYAGCSALATAIVEGTAPVSGCPVGGAEAAEKIGKIMGVSTEFIPKSAVVRCLGTCEKALNKYIYEGLDDCRAASQLSGGPKVCDYGCIGLGSCVKKCPYGALSLKDGIAVVDQDKCRACGICVAECPKGLISLQRKDAPFKVLCRSHDSGKNMRDICAAGCIGCGICAKICPVDAITVNGALAEINPEKCVGGGCGACRDKCPRHIISAS